MVKGLHRVLLCPGHRTQVQKEHQTQQGSRCEESKEAHEDGRLNGQVDQGALSWDLVGQAEHVAERPGYAAVPRLWSKEDSVSPQGKAPGWNYIPRHNRANPTKLPQPLCPREVSGPAHSQTRDLEGPAQQRSQKGLNAVGTSVPGRVCPLSRGARGPALRAAFSELGSVPVVHFFQ